MINKDTIAEMIGLDDADKISDEVYNYAVNKFYNLTGFNKEETDVVYKKLIQSSKSIIKTNFNNIQSIEEIRVNNIAQDFTLYSNLNFNSESGLIVYDTGVEGYVEIDITLAPYTHTTTCDYLISLLTYKGVLLFTPQYSENIKRIKIGDYEKELFSTMNYKEGPQDLLDKEIAQTVTSILNKGTSGLSMGDII